MIAKAPQFLWAVVGFFGWAVSTGYSARLAYPMISQFLWAPHGLPWPGGFHGILRPVGISDRITSNVVEAK